MRKKKERNTFKMRIHYHGMLWLQLNIDTDFYMVSDSIPFQDLTAPGL